MLETPEGTVTAQEAKHEATFNFFQQHIGTHQDRKHRLNYANIGWQRQQLQHLDLPFHEQEIVAVIKALPSEKAPGPDGFIGLFSQALLDHHKGRCHQCILPILQYEI